MSILVNEKETIIEMSDNYYINEDYKRTGFSDAIFFLILGFVLHKIYILPAVLAFMYSFKAKQKLEKQKFSKYQKYYRIAYHFNLINYCLLFSYILLRFLSVLSIICKFEIIQIIDMNDSIFFSFISFSLQK